MNLAMQGNDNLEGKSPEPRSGQSPYRIPAERAIEEVSAEPKESVIILSTRIRYLLEDMYDRVGDAGTTVWKHTPMGVMEEISGRVAQFFSGGRYIYDANPPTRAQIREVSRRMEQVDPKRYMKELKKAYGIEK